MIHNKNVLDEKLNLNDSSVNKINENKNINSLESEADILTKSILEKIIYPKKNKKIKK